jgi:hypothetical protein
MRRLSTVPRAFTSGRFVKYSSVTVAGDTSSVAMTLTAGYYRFRVRAENLVGSSPWSDPSNSVKAR